MAQAYISTAQPALRIVNVEAVATGTTAASYSNRVPTSIKPTSGVVLDASLTQGYWNPSLIKVCPFGSKDDQTSWTTSGTTTGFRLIGWQSYADLQSGDVYWCPTILAQYALLFASTPSNIGITDTTYSAAFFFSGGAVQLGTGAFPAPNTYMPTPAGGGSITTPASYLIDIAGSQLVTVDFICPAPGVGRTTAMGLLWYAI